MRRLGGCAMKGKDDYYFLRRVGASEQRRETRARGESSVRMSTSDYTLLLPPKATALECPTERRLAVSSDEPLVEETEHLATDLLAPRLLVIQNTVRGGEHNHAEETRREETADPVLDVRVGEIVTGAVMRGGRNDVSFPRRTESASGFSTRKRATTLERQKTRFARSGLDRAGDVPDDTALVDAPVEFHDNLASPVVVNVFELVDVTWGEREEARVSEWFTRKRESRPTTMDRGVSVPETYRASA